MTRDEQLKAAKAKAQVALAKANDGNVTEATTLLADARTMVQTAPEPTPEAPAPVTMVQLPDTVTLTREQYQMIGQRQYQLEMELQSAKVKELCDAALARGVPPAVVNTAMPVLMACQRDAQPTIKLTTDTQPINLFDAVAAILVAVPGRVGEITAPDVGSRPVTLSKPLTPEEAEELARKRRKELGIIRTATAEVEL